MGRFNQEAFGEGKPISKRGFSKGLRAMAYALEHMSVLGGRVDWSAFGAPTIVPFAEDGRNSYSKEGSIAKPWDISFYLDGESIMAACTNCVYMRGPVTKSVEVDPLELTIDDVFISAEINNESGAAVLAEYESFEDATDGEVPTSDTTYKRLLYRAVKVSNTYVVTEDYRTMPQLGGRQ